MDPLVALPDVTECPDAFRDIIADLNVPYEGNWPDRFGQELRVWMHARNKRVPRVLSVFSGAGGLDIGFHDAGFDVVEMVEIDPRFTRTLHANAGTGKYLGETRINTVDIREYDFDGEEVDFIIGGPPCQTFSAAGRRAAGVQGLDDARGRLFREYVRLLRTLKPRGFLFENVYGITGAQNGDAWREILSSFEAVGYDVTARVLDAADFGVPQHRERLFIIGCMKGFKYRFPRPTHGPDSPTKCEFRTAGEALEGLQKPQSANTLNGRYGHLLADIPPGLNYSFYTQELGHPHPVFAWRSKFSDFLYKADPDTPIRTLKAYGGKYTGPFHWESRPLTIEELKRLQTFPDDYAIIGSRQLVATQIGNSVPPQIARLLGLSVMCQLFDVITPGYLPTLSDTDKLFFRQRKRQLTQKYSLKASNAISNSFAPTRVRLVAPGRSQYVLTNSLRLKEVLSPAPDSYICSVDVEDESLTIRCTRDEHRSKFTIAISPRDERQWLSPYKLIRISGTIDPKTERWNGFVIAWKLLEKTLEDANIATDLVQLSGYYQYPARMKCILEFSGPVRRTAFATVLLHVTSGVGVGETLPLTVLSNLWSLPEEGILFAASLLRHHGYEVRNSSTNPQLPKDHVLIPYAFPTLSESSVQYHKSLGW